jgi:hypothetical protein
LETTAELVTEIANSSHLRIKPVELSRGRYGGTYVVEDLALTYAMWIGPKFHLTSSGRSRTPDRPVRPRWVTPSSRPVLRWSAC